MGQTIQEITQLFIQYQSLFYQGIRITLLVALTGTVFGLLLGFVLSGMRLVRITGKENIFLRIIKWLIRFIAKAYIEFVRGTPMMVQGVFLYNYFYRFLQWTPVQASIIIVSFNTAAYMAEIIRSGIQSVDPGQREAALTIGMSESQAFRLIILPQAIRNSFPSIGNEFVVNIKDTSVLNVIGLTELFFQGMSVAGTTYAFTESMMIIAVIYFILTFAVTRVLGLVERRMGMQSKGIQSQTMPIGEM